MRHMLAYTSSIANGSSLLQLSALADGIVPTRDSAFIAVGGLRYILGIRGFGVNLTRVSLQPPSIRGIGNYEVVPVQNVAAAGDQVEPIVCTRTNPLIVESGEEIPVFVIQSNAGAQQQFVLLDVGTEIPHPVEGRILTIRATGTFTQVANAWASGALTFDSNLPARKFKVVGARVKTATGLAFRFIVPGMVYRPGGFVSQSDLSHGPVNYRRGGMGVWFEFDYVSPPSLEVIGTAADTAQTVELDIIPE